ncbi:hypothetical protein ACMT1E_11435 [Sphingomonas flavalba]|uniref:hypothetical protein n=1 Tax=Sphingomonas flavalba TaxID=2559804 RepID=UPI0039E18D75
MPANWPLILLVLLVIAVGLWWLLGRSKSIDTRTGATPDAPKVPEAPAPAPLERATTPPPVAPQPLTSAPAPAEAAPAPVAPPAPPVAKTAPAAKPVPAKPAAPAKPKTVAKAPAAKAPAAPKPTAKPKAAVKPKAAPAATPATPDDLLLLKGVGPKLAVLLNELGVSRFEQIAGWSDAELARIDAQLGAFKGRAARDKWVEQAGYLAKGDTAGFEAKFGKL